MSFLVYPGDPETLAEALAFVDGFDFPGDDNNTDEASGSSDNGVERVVESHKRRWTEVKDGEAPPDKHDKAKSRRKNAVYSARLRAKKKNEMQQLKEQVTTLQMQLERLRSPKMVPFTALAGSDHSRLLPAEGCRTGSNCWLKEATEQAYQRQQAEKVNAQLKLLFAKVVKRSKTMQDAFHNLQSLGCEINVSVGAPSTILAGTSLRSNDATSQLGELRECMDQMYAEAHDVFATSGARAVEATSFVSQIKRDPASGRKFVQLSSSTPLASDLDGASRMIWQGMQLKGSKCNKYHVHRLHVNASSIAKSFFLTLSAELAPCTLHGAAIVRKFEERDRIMYIWTTAMVPSRKESGSQHLDSNWWNLRVREKGWIRLPRSDKNPEHASLLHTCYEVSSVLGDNEHDADCAPAAISYDHDYDRIGNGVVNLLSSDLRKFHERVQDKLVADASFAAAC